MFRPISVMYALTMIGLVPGTEDEALFSDRAQDFWGYVGMLIGESLRLFSAQLIFIVM
jgi:hypothetical protein